MGDVRVLRVPPRFCACGHHVAIHGSPPGGCLRCRCRCFRPSIEDGGDPSGGAVGAAVIVVALLALAVVAATWALGLWP